jgi:adenosine deaminase
MTAASPHPEPSPSPAPPPDWLETLPKVELHVHLEGTAPPALVRELAARNGLELPDGVLADPHRFAWGDFLEFLRTYELAASVLRTADDYRDLTFDYLARCAEEGVIYAELTAAPDLATDNGLPLEDFYAGVAAGIDAARAEHGIEARVLVGSIRHLGPERVLAQARRHAATPFPYVVGFSMGGDEAGYPADRFHAAFDAAREAGLGCTVHAGEHGGPESVRAALALPVTRIAHGVRAIEDPAVVDDLLARGIVLEACPTSNVATGVYPTMRAHPLRRLWQLGVPLTLGSDDPPYFDASIGGEYAVAHAHFGFRREDLLRVTRTAIDASFAEPALKRALRAALEAEPPTT